MKSVFLKWTHIFLKIKINNTFAVYVTKITDLEYQAAGIDLNSVKISKTLFSRCNLIFVKDKQGTVKSYLHDIFIWKESFILKDKQFGINCEEMAIKTSTYIQGERDKLSSKVRKNEINADLNLPDLHKYILKY